MKVRGRGGLGTTQLGAGVSVGQVQLSCRQKISLIFFLKAFGIEFLITMVLVLVVFGAAADGNNSVKVLF